MSPPLPSNDQRDKRLVNTELLCNSSLCRATPAELTDGSHISLTQFCAADLASFQCGRAMTALSHHVRRVVGLRSEKQMRWTDARRVIALMEYMKAAGNRTIFNLPRYTRRELRAARTTANTDAAITSAAPARSPDPTRSKVRTVRRHRSVFVDLSPKPIFYRARFDRHEMTASEIEMVADTPRFGDGHGYSTSQSRISINPKGVSHSIVAENGG